MNKNDMIQTDREKFITPKAEIIVFSTEDVITASDRRGGFPGEWDEDA